MKLDEEKKKAAMSNKHNKLNSKMLALEAAETLTVTVKKEPGSHWSWRAASSLRTCPYAFIL